MNDKVRPLVVIGSGLSGYTVIRQVREYQKERAIVLITADGGEVYSKPLLSNALAKEQTPEGMVQKAAAAKAEELGVTLLNRCFVDSIDAEARVLNTGAGRIAYEQLVLATGAHQRVILPEGAEPDWIDTVNSLDDYRGWYGKLDRAKKILLIGAGLIGCEFADDLMSRGHAVELVDPAPWPLSRLLPEQVGAAMAEALIEAGAKLHMGRYVARLDKTPAGRLVATLNDGAIIETDLALSAVGLVPESALAASAGLLCEQGVIVDRQLRTSDPHIFALGDCAETPAGYLPYVLPIMSQARTLGQVLAGRDASLAMKAMPVLVKTTSLPLVVCPPKVGARGGWFVEGEGRDLTAIFYEADGIPLGFAVTGRALDKKMALAKQMPALLAD